MRNFFKPLAPETPVRQVANIRDMEIIRNFIDTVQGVNCRVVIPADGIGARIIIDGNTDVESPPNITNPFNGSANSFLAGIELDSGSWDFTEKKQEAGGFSDLAGGRTGEADEINGIDPPMSGVYSFLAYVFEYDDGGTTRYSFAYPIEGGGTDGQIFVTDSNGIPQWADCVTGIS